jgi:L-rhamnose mutarotase
MLSIAVGTEEEFDRRHREIWPEMTEAMKESGFGNYTLFRRGDTVVGYAECEPDVESAGRRMAETPVAARWGESMAGIVVVEPGSTGIERIDEVWHLQ